MNFSKNLFLLLLFPFLLNGNSFIPIELKNGANSSFRDELPDDEKGGWTDQGSCDMRLLPAGKFLSGNVRFQILSDKETNGKSCIVVGNMENRSFFRKRARVTCNLTKHRPVLYLLHAGQWLKKDKRPAGVLKIEFTDGTKASHNLRYGRDLLNWTGDETTPAKNAKKVWTIYNNSTQVSLFLTKIGIKSGKIVKSIEFESGYGAWMVAAVSLGKPVSIAGEERVKKAIPEDYAVPAPLHVPLWTKTKLKNVIMIIGDGMGSGAVQAASFYAHGADRQLIMHKFPVQTRCMTNSFGGATTDSAASGTALSGGYKTRNGMLGMNPEKTAFDSIAREAKKSGMAVGLVTTDHMLGATPSAFYTHVPSRSMRAEIAASILKCEFDILIASPDRRYFLPPRSLNGNNYLKKLESAGYQLFDDYRKFLSSDGVKKVFGTFSLLGATDRLAKTSEKAISILEKNPKGFFIMIECGVPDQGGHGNRPDKTIFGTLATDYAAKIALEYAIRKRDTLVIVTADHETGGVSAENNPKNRKQVFIRYASGQHTPQPVPFFAYGPGAGRFAKELDNTDIPKIISKLLKLELGNKTVE
ncbi:MAG: alkaline phosphatase [Lentisphaeria bacterium]|nr:alkaline phosphatase [Lentisphaeria bacterium]